MTQAVRASFETLREVSFSALTAGYTALGAPLSSPARVIGITNSTDQDIYISIDGINDHLRLSKNSFKLFDVSTNTKTDYKFEFPKNMQVYVKYANAPASGVVWVETLFGVEN